MPFNVVSRHSVQALLDRDQHCYLRLAELPQNLLLLHAKKIDGVTGLPEGRQCVECHSVLPDMNLLVTARPDWARVRACRRMHSVSGLARRVYATFGPFSERRQVLPSLPSAREREHGGEPGLQPRLEPQLG